MGKLRVIYAHDGVSLFDHIFLRFLLSRGHEVHLVTFYHPPFFSKHMHWNLPRYTGLKIHHYDTGRLAVPLPYSNFHVIASRILILSYLVKKIKPDVLNGHWAPSYGFYSAMTAFHPFLLTIWGSDILLMPKKSIVAKKTAELALKKADLVMVDSEVQKREAVRLGCNPRKIVSFPWAVDLDKFNPRVTGERVRKKLGFEGNPVIFCARQHEERYGVEYFIESIPYVAKEVPDARFVIGGVGSLTEKYIMRIKERGLSGYVRFVGKIPHGEMPEYMAACDVYVSPSLSDGSSATLLEAMACGKPVIVSDIPGNREWVEHSVNGLIIPTRSPSSIASSILYLFNNPTHMKRFGERNVHIAKQRANLNESLKIYEKILCDLVYAAR